MAQAEQENTVENMDTEPAYATLKLSNKNHDGSMLSFSFIVQIEKAQIKRQWLHSDQCCKPRREHRLHYEGREREIPGKSWEEAIKRGDGA